MLRHRKFLTAASVITLSLALPLSAQAQDEDRVLDVPSITQGDIQESWEETK